MTHCFSVKEAFSAPCLSFPCTTPLGRGCHLRKLDSNWHLGIKGISWHFMRHVSDFHGNLIPKYFKLNCYKKQCACCVYDWQLNLRSSSPDRFLQVGNEKEKEHIKAQLQYGFFAIKMVHLLILIWHVLFFSD